MTAVRALNGAHDSVEEYCFALNGLGWETDFRQLSPGPGTSAFRAAATDTAAVLRVDCCSRIHQRAVPIQGYQTFGIPFRQQAPGKIGSRVLESNSLLLIDPHHGLDAVVEPGFSAYTVSVSDLRLQQLADLHELPDPTTSVAVPGSERVPEPPLLAQIKTSLETVLGRADSPASLNRAKLDRQIEGRQFDSVCPCCGLTCRSLIDKADETLGAVNATKLAAYERRMTVTVRLRPPESLLVRASASTRWPRWTIRRPIRISSRGL
jgi:hypothetical protein